MKPRLSQTVLALCALVVSIPAFATAQRTFVASTGNDANPCSLTLPCRGFATAVAAVDAGGEVVALDSAGYGAFAITKSVSVVAPNGVYAGISVFSGDGVTVAAAANDKVVVRGLTINGQGAYTLGIRVESAGEVHIENCVVSNMTFAGIVLNGGARTYVRQSVIRGNDWGLNVGQMGYTGPAYVSDSHFSDNGGAIMIWSGTLLATRVVVEGSRYDGISICSCLPPPGVASRAAATEPAVTVVLSDSVLSGNGLDGASARAERPGWSVRMEFIRSTSARNAQFGLSVESGSGPAFLVVTDSSVVDNGNHGITAAGAGATAVVTGSTIAGNNGADLVQSGAVFRTSGTNTLTGRGAADVIGTLTLNPMK